MEADESRVIAQQWCASKGAGWSLGEQLGQGGTAPVFEVASPDGPRALKIYDSRFCTGKLGKLEKSRIEKQLSLKGHDCPHLVQIYDGGTFRERLYLLMERARGLELEKQLRNVPRGKIRQIADQVAQAANFLSERGLCHRDIKAANIYITKDFEHCTLLDVSVVRDIHDPIGVGTDQEGQLPVVATARYSPPEYLFRLLDPGPQLWQALNVYQLGALLHDLIMRRTLFQSEYDASRDNRYRFAWIVATTVPEVAAADVDQDLVVTARRALDKDWKRRLELEPIDFRSKPSVRKAHALQALGLGKPRYQVNRGATLAQNLARLGALCRGLEEAVVKYLRGSGVTPTHEIMPGTDDLSRTISISWDATEIGTGQRLIITCKFQLGLIVDSSNVVISLRVALCQRIGESETEVSLQLPATPDAADVDVTLSQNSVVAIEELAQKITAATQEH